MSSVGCNIFSEEPNTVKEMFCNICGTRCEVEHNELAPPVGRSSMAGKSHLHDRFACRTTAKFGMTKLLELYMEAEQTASQRLAALIRLDLDDLLCENGCKPSSD